jgi:hypothetical protein
VWNASFLPTKAELNVLPRAEEVSEAANFVDFRDVWLAYNDELLRENHFAVEAIDLQVRRASSSPSSAPRAAASPPS